MITFTVKYPYKKGCHFDMGYYLNVHIGIAKKYFGNKCKGYTILGGESSLNEGKAPQFACLSHLFFNSLEEFKTAMAPAEKELLADVKNFTDIIPEVEFSGVSMHEWQE